MQNADYSPHCGHGIIALATAAVELGWVERTVPETRVGIDAPCGFIEAFVEWDGTNVANVRFVNVPSFVWQLDVTVTTPTFGPVTGDIAYGGAFYLYVDGAAYGLDIRESEAGRLKHFGMEVKDAANAAFSVVHPEIPEIGGVYGTIISGAPRHPALDPGQRLRLRRPGARPLAHGVGHRRPDRATARTGTVRARRDPGQRIDHRIGLQGPDPAARPRVAGQPAVIPEIQGNAFICGFGNWMIDDRDPLSYGFQLAAATIERAGVTAGGRSGGSPPRWPSGPATAPGGLARSSGRGR